MITVRAESRGLFGLLHSVAVGDGRMLKAAADWVGIRIPPSKEEIDGCRGGGVFYQVLGLLCLSVQVCLCGFLPDAGLALSDTQVGESEFEY